MNIQTAIKQMRVARNLGQISATVQSRTLRRLGYAPALALQAKIKAEETAPVPAELSNALLALGNLRNTVDNEVAPILKEKQDAEMLFECPAKLRKSLMECCVELVDTAVVNKPELTGEEYTPQWWKAAEVRERAARKAGNTSWESTFPL